ncbi:hypothetical protein HYX19_04575 [Candidatus Woesearchaeota archaeon]|nr:hypothetical protein [Candidatus Woesearchaeota archaeon]
MNKLERVLGVGALVLVLNASINLINYNHINGRIKALSSKVDINQIVVDELRNVQRNLQLSPDFCETYKSLDCYTEEFVTDKHARILFERGNDYNNENRNIQHDIDKLLRSAYKSRERALVYGYFK